MRTACVCQRSLLVGRSETPAFLQVGGGFALYRPPRPTYRSGVTLLDGEQVFALCLPLQLVVRVASCFSLVGMHLPTGYGLCLPSKPNARHLNVVSGTLDKTPRFRLAVGCLSGSSGGVV